jgi:death on curing protein
LSLSFCNWTKLLKSITTRYLFHIIRNHPFIDGNKRTGAVAAVVFFTMNGMDLDASEESFEEMVYSVADGKIDKSEITQFFKNNTRVE